MSSAIGYPPSTVIGYPTEYYLRRQPNSQRPDGVHPQPNRTQTTAAAAARISRAPQSDVSRNGTIDDDDDQEHASDGPCIILVVLNIILVLFLVVVGLFCFVNHGRRSDDDGGKSFINIPKFEVESFSMSNSINISESSPLSWNIGFNITNPNERVTFSYDEVLVYVVYRKETLSGTTLKPFNLGSKTSTLLSSNVVGSAQNLEEWALSAIERDVITEGTVSFDVGFRSTVEFGPSDFMEYFSSLKVYCEGLSVKFSSNATAAGGGTMVTGSKDCKASLSGS